VSGPHVLLLSPDSDTGRRVANISPPRSNDLFPTTEGAPGSEMDCPMGRATCRHRSVSRDAGARGRKRAIRLAERYLTIVKLRDCGCERCPAELVAVITSV
jgi:hypothetical protein